MSQRIDMKIFCLLFTRGL